MNQTQLANLDRLIVEMPEGDQPILLAELAKRILASQQTATSFELRDADDRAISLIAPRKSGAGKFLKTEEEFIEVLKHRIAHPPDRFLTVEEFFALLDSQAAGANEQALTFLRRQFHFMNRDSDSATEKTIA